MKNIKTLDEIFEDLDPYYAHLFTDNIIEFTQYHVSQALEAASEVLECYPSEREQILSAYPLTNIK